MRDISMKQFVYTDDAKNNHKSIIQLGQTIEGKKEIRALKNAIASGLQRQGMYYASSINDA